MAADLLELLAHEMATQRAPSFDHTAGSFGAVLSALMVAVPQVLSATANEPPDATLTDETTAEWRAVAQALSPWVELVGLTRKVARAGLASAEIAHLRQLAGTLLDLQPARGLSAAELADRVQPLLELRIEEALRGHGAWPPSRALPLPAYDRALVALWEDAADLLAPRACLTVGCGGELAGASKARYCESCRRRRQADRVSARRRRSRTRAGR